MALLVMVVLLSVLVSAVHWFLLSGVGGDSLLVAVQLPLARHTLSAQGSVEMDEQTEGREEEEEEEYGKEEEKKVVSQEALQHRALHVRREDPLQSTWYDGDNVLDPPQWSDGDQEEYTVLLDTGDYVLEEQDMDKVAAHAPKPSAQSTHELPSAAKWAKPHFQGAHLTVHKHRQAAHPTIQHNMPAAHSIPQSNRQAAHPTLWSNGQATHSTPQGHGQEAHSATQSDGLVTRATQSDGLVARATQSNGGLVARATQSDGLVSHATQSDGLVARATQSDRLVARATQSDGLVARATQSDGLVAHATQSDGLVAHAEAAETLPRENGTIPGWDDRERKSKEALGQGLAKVFQMTKESYFSELGLATERTSSSRPASLPSSSPPSHAVSPSSRCSALPCLELLNSAEKYIYTKCTRRAVPGGDRHSAPSCKCRFVDRRGRKSVALVSLPGSGNTWVRGLLEKATGICTGSIYCDRTLREGGFCGEGLRGTNLIAVKTHDSSLAWRGGGRAEPTRPVFDKAIFLIRNPFRANIAEWNRQISRKYASEQSGSSHVKYVSSPAFFGKSCSD